MQKKKKSTTYSFELQVEKMQEVFHGVNHQIVLTGDAVTVRP